METRLAEYLHVLKQKARSITSGSKVKDVFRILAEMAAIVLLIVGLLWACDQSDNDGTLLPEPVEESTEQPVPTEMPKPTVSAPEPTVQVVDLCPHKPFPTVDDIGSGYAWNIWASCLPYP